MALESLSVAFNTGHSGDAFSGLNPIPISAGFPVKFAWPRMNGQTGSSDAASTSAAVHFSEGLFIASGAQHAAGFADVDGASASPQSNSVTDGCLIEVATSDGSIVGKLVAAVSGNDITFTPVSAFSQDFRVHVLLAGGAGLRASHLTTTTEPSAGGSPSTSSITDCPFQPTTAIAVQLAATSSRAQIGVGFAAQNESNSAIVNGVIGSAAFAGDAAHHYARTGYALAVLGGSTGISGRGGFDSWTATGANLAWDEANGRGTWSVALLDVDSALVRNDTYDDHVSTNTHEFSSRSPFVPRCGLTISARHPEQAADASDQEMRVMMGSFDSALNMHALAFVRAYADPTQIQLGREEDAIYTGEDIGGSQIVDAPLALNTVVCRNRADDWTPCWEMMLVLGDGGSTDVAASYALPLESLAPIALARALPVESLGRVAASYALPIEALAAVSRSFSACIEALGVLAASVAIPLESLGLALRAPALPLESEARPRVYRRQFAAAAAYNITIPTCEDGSFVIVKVVSARSTATTTATTGWTLLTTSTAGGTAGSTVRVSLFWKATAAADSGTTLVVDVAGGVSRVAVADIIYWGPNDWSGTPSNFGGGTPTTGAPGTNGDPPNLASAWGAGITSTWIASISLREDTGADAITGTPSGFRAEPTNIKDGTGAGVDAEGVQSGLAFKTSSNASEDPAAFTHASLYYTSNTYVVRGKSNAVSRAPDLPLEALGFARRRPDLPMESLGSVTASPALALESLLTVMLGSPLPVEALRGVAAAPAMPLESIGTVRMEQGLPVEALQSIRALTALPLESMLPVVYSTALPIEVLAGVSGQLLAIPLEALGGVVLLVPLPIEALENLGQVSAAYALPIEALGAVLQTAEINIETVGPFFIRSGENPIVSVDVDRGVVTLDVERGVDTRTLH